MILQSGTLTLNYDKQDTSLFSYDNHVIITLIHDTVERYINFRL